MTTRKELIQSLSSRPMEFSIPNFPLPPSVNMLHRYVQGRVIKSKAYNDYEKRVYGWLTMNQAQIKGVREFVKDIGDYVIHIESIFMMNHRDIVCLNGKPKRNDTSNRLKALHDVLSDIIMGIDDSYFWSGSFSKESVGSRSKECVQLTMKLRIINNSENSGEEK